MLHSVLLCGGSGSRLWPVSRGLYPKQFLALHGANTLLEDTVKRARAVDGEGKVIAVANNEHRFMVAEQLRRAGVDEPAILLEPVGRNTAPAVAVAALQALASDSSPLLLVMPSDHLIQDSDAFSQAVVAGMEAAAEGRLVTFGIVPSAPETGYGYIRFRGESDGRVRDVAQFVEKPDFETAQSYLGSGDYLWNSGIFLLDARAYLEELGRYRPDILEAAEAAFTRGKRDLDFFRLDAEAFAACPSESIDYAVMEHTDRAVVVPLECGWSDLGSWGQLHELSKNGDDGNVLIGDVIAEDTSDSYIRSEGRLVATLGVENLVVVETADAVLVADRARVQDVKQIVDRLKADGRDEHSIHRRVYRPWGAYEGITEADRFQVKRIVVNPGGQLSLQMHHHRAEHWVIVSGTARVYRGDESFLLSEDQSTYIPLGTVHRLENPGVIPLELIEVQTGAYLGEDDIVRFQDCYGRVEQKG